jgi:hypothetical protein
MAFFLKLNSVKMKNLNKVMNAHELIQISSL